ncbi:hypothetical protein MOQ_001628 [Trypanosoma cruzi marinkellei]|uniref:Uncharacterized protein n=1 Tax=Trypanosoma cruzi marinkellei TaxID=85056 RepID=K2PAT2_TRYCR|nr:hypothetical protein MOQ_001628 [Trypanosoma cruzi marinkellei]
MGMTPVRRVLHREGDAPLWFISAPAELQPHDMACGNGTPASGAGGGKNLPTSGMPPPVHCQLRLVPLIKRYFPSSSSVLFQQLVEARKRQHPRYHFHCTQHLPPTAYLDPTVHYFDLDLGGREVQESDGVEGYNEAIPALSAPFLSPNTLYSLLVEGTEVNLFDSEDALNAAMRAELEGGGKSAWNDPFREGVGGVEHGGGHNGKSNMGHTKQQRVRPVPCAILLLRYHDAVADVSENNNTLFGLAAAVEAVSASPQKGDAAASVMVEKDGRSWLVWEVDGVSLSARVGGFYGCWTVDELFGHMQGAGTVCSTLPNVPSSIPHSLMGPFGLNGDSLVVTGFVERDVGEREQPHAWMAACRAFASSMMDTSPHFMGNDGTQQPCGGDMEHHLPSYPFSLLRHLDLAFIPQLSNIPQLQLCRQIHLFMDTLEELAPAVPTLAKLHVLQRQRNKRPTTGETRGSMPPTATTCGSAFPVKNALTGTAYGNYGGSSTMVVGDASHGLGPIAVPQITPRISHPLPLTTLQEKGVCSYFLDGAVVLRLSNAKVVEALQKLWCVPLSDTTEALMMALTSRVPPPLVFRGELRPPNPSESWNAKVRGVVPRSGLELSGGCLLPWGFAQSHDVFSVGREFDGAPFQCLFSSAAKHVLVGSGMHSKVQGTVGGKPSANCSSAATLRFPDTSVSFGDLIRFDPVEGCWYIDSSLRAEDVALSWMRRLTGKAREAKDVDARWLLYPNPVSQDPMEHGSRAGEIMPSAGSAFVRLGRLRPWHIKHDGYSYFHCVAVRSSVAGGVAAEADGEAAVISSTKKASGKRKSGESLSVPLPKGTAACQKTTQSAMVSESREAAPQSVAWTQSASSHQPSTTTTTSQPTFRLPIFNYGAPGGAGGPKSYEANGGGCGNAAVEARDDSSPAISKIVDGWGAVGVGQVPSTCSSNINASCGALGGHNNSSNNRAGAFWEQTGQTHCADRHGLDQENSMAHLGMSLHGSNNNGILAAPKFGTLRRHPTKWTPQSPVRLPFSPATGNSSVFVLSRTSPTVVSHGSPASQTSSLVVQGGPAPFSTAKAPVRNRTCAPNDDNHVLIGSMDSFSPCSVDGGQMNGDCSNFLLTPPSVGSLPHVDLIHLNHGVARTARPSDDRKSHVESAYHEMEATVLLPEYRQDDVQGSDPLLYDIQGSVSLESSPSISSLQVTSVRIYKEDRHFYHWNPYGTS